jgi:hypothetical protein
MDEELKLTPQMIHLVNEAARKGLLGAPPASESIRWPAPRQLTDAEMADLAPIPRPPDVQPKSLEEEFLLQKAQERYWRLDRQRMERVASLGRSGDGKHSGHANVMLRCQHASQCAYADPGQPLWLCQVIAVGDCGDSGVPPVVVRADSAEQARERSAQLWGLTDGVHGLGNDARGRQELQVQQWQQPAA